MPLQDIKIPGWSILLDLAAKCYEVSELGYLGCDIVLDKTHGAMILELNARPGLSIQIANNSVLLPRLNHLQAMDTRKMAIEERVQYARQTLAAI